MNRHFFQSLLIPPDSGVLPHLREIDENTIIMLGRIRSQGQDIKRIFQYMETIDERLNRLETKSDEQTALLTQILARLPETH